MLKLGKSVRAVTGPQLHCKNWQIEGIYRMLHNVLDPEVAKDPENLIVYGGTGRAARNWPSFEKLVETLKFAGYTNTGQDCTASCRVVAGPGIYDDAEASIEYTGAWQVIPRNGAYHGSYHLSSATGDSARFTYRGAGFTYAFCAGPNRGKTAVYLDGVLKALVDNYAPNPICGRVYTFRNVPPDIHLLEVRESRLKNPLSTGYHISLDALAVFARLDFAEEPLTMPE
ncbi:MAG: hypothetical protein HY784_04985 [Chloroflexi bacterium]|nr:hypothetical protein [Chloroflexota bacterium]